MSSFFGKSQDKAASKDVSSAAPGIVQSTGGKIDDMVVALIASANDGDGAVRSSISKSLLEIGKKQPNLVVSTCIDFMNKNAKQMAREHRVIVLNVIHQVLEAKRDDILPSLSVHLIALAVDEMTKEKEVIPEWQGAAAQVMVSLGMRFPNEILEELMKRFNPGSVPHYFIMKTLGDFVIANPLDTVPRLKEIFARILPVLASVKHDNMRWVFASGFGHFCEAIVNYVANIEKAKDKNFTISSFSSDVFPAYEILFNNWLGSKESKVRVTSAQALGSICLVLSKDQLEQQLIKLVPTFLQLFKKEKELLPVTQGFSSILEASTRDGSRSLDPHLQVILQTIHPLACVTPDYSNSAAIKNYNELLRCIQTIGTPFSDAVVTFLLERLANKDPLIRSGTLAIFKFMIARMDPILADKKGLLVSGIKPLTQSEPNLTVKRELAQLVITMASHNYLSLEGGETLVEFVIRHSGISDDEITRFNKERKKDKEPPGVVTPEELRSLCDNILHLTTTTIPQIHKVYWPYLLEFIVPVQYTDALGVLCKCTAHIAGQKREEEAQDYIIDFDRAVNLPKPQAIISRLLVMLNGPNRRGQLGLNILQALKTLGPILHPSIYEMWDTAIPKLVSFLESNTEAWNQNLWEDLILRLLSETIKMANDDDWVIQLGEQLAKQIDLYNRDPDMKRVAYKHLGLILQKSNHKEFIKTKIETMLSSADSNNDLERTGCAQGIGYCAASHLDMTLEKIQGPKTPATPTKQKSGGLFGFLGNSSPKQDSGPTDVNNTVILCYGYIAAYSPPSLITSRIEISILNHLKPIIAKAKHPSTKECIIRTIDLIGKAMHPSHLEKDFILKPRDDLLKILIGFLTGNKNDVPDVVRNSGLSACATLLNLQPVLPADLEKALVDRVISFYGLPPTEEKEALQQTLDNLNSVLGALLLSQPGTEILVRLLTSLEPLVSSKEAFQRERSSQSVLFLLKKFIEVLKSKDSLNGERPFSEVGNCIAMLVPRCTDPAPTVRQLGIEGIQACIYIDLIIKNGKNTDIPEELLLFKDFKQRIVTEELNEQFSIVHELSRALSRLVPAQELPDLLLTACRGLNDSQVTSTSGTCVVINGLIKVRGQELATSLPKIIAGLLSSMETITIEQTMNGTLHAIKSLAIHHQTTVVNLLLEAPIPHTTFVVKSLQAIAKDPKLVMELVNQLLDIINKSQLHEEHPDPKNKGRNIMVPCHLPMSATCALGEILQLDEMEDVVTEHYHLILSSILLRIGTSNGLVDNQAIEQTSTTLRKFLECSKDEAIQAAMTKGDHWSRLPKPEYYKAIIDITAAVCKDHPKQMNPIFEFLVPYLRGNFSGQRTVAATILSEFINHCKNDRALLQQLVNHTLSSLADPVVKIHALRGLGNIVGTGSEEANKYAPTILDALMSSIDDSNETLAMEGMNSLAKVFEIVEEARISPVLVNICLRIKPAFDKENDEIRAAAYTLFGSLYRFGLGSAKEVFYDQIHNNFPTLILHINEDNATVKTACKTALRQLAPLYRCDELKDLLLSSTLDPTRQFMDYPEFLNDLSKILITRYPEKINLYAMTCVEYYKSNWNTIKANAAAFTGYLLGNFPTEKRRATNLNPGLISRALIELLKEKSGEVRKTAAEAMSLLHTY